MASPTSEAPHPTTGGKSLEFLTSQQQQPRAPYKSWRKKYRKMRAHFDTVLEDNKRIFRDEQKLEDLARRLQEELDTMMEIMLELNASSGLPSHLRYGVVPNTELHARIQPTQNVVKNGILPDAANTLMKRYQDAVQEGVLPSIELHFVREQIQDRLAEQGVRQLSELEQQIQPNTARNNRGQTKRAQLLQDVERYQTEIDIGADPSYLAAEHEDAYLARLDAKISGQDHGFSRPETRFAHQAELTPRELERQLELLNPQSQHNWLRSHPRSSATAAHDDLADEGAPSKANARKRASLKGSLAKSLGDRMLRDGRSPSEASGMGYDDDTGADEYHGGTGRRRTIDRDPTFRGKVGKAGGSTKAKRKRLTDEGAGGGKRIRATEVFD